MTSCCTKSGDFVQLGPDDPNLPSGTKKEQQFTTYDALEQADLTVLTTIDTEYQKPTFLSGNVAKTKNENTTTYYSYDIYGRVKYMVQDIAGLGLKTINYKYDAITGAVLKVDYQKKNALERFVHSYTYNTIDQLIKVETSTDDATYTNQAEYTYYETGALRRTVLAENLQGIDYIYNLAGQLKAINDPDGNDPGNDGSNGVSADVFSMTLDYYTGDYNRANIHTVTEGNDQYNGNIKAMTWKTNGAVADGRETYYYDYNKNNWLASAGFSAPVDGRGSVLDSITKNGVITTNGQALARKCIILAPGFHVAAGVEYLAKIDPNATGADGGDHNVTNLTYDQNGNILSLNRNKDTQSGNNRMDELTYHYKPNLNQLDHVSDKVDEDGITTNADDIKTQAANNYSYNSIGQLVSNTEEGISYMYNASGLVTEVQKGNLPLVKFYYNDKGHRVRKESFVNGKLTSTDHYVRDAAGSTLAIYKNSTLTEMPIYGASRLGVHYKTGSKDVYQLTDHLGNVRAVIAKVSNSAAISSSTDYYPGGMAMPGRQTVGGELYRYGYQGEFAETDPETGKPMFQLRLYDQRINRWLSPDPYGQYASPYLSMGNNWINRIDPDGGYDEPPTWEGNDGDFYHDPNDNTNYVFTEGTWVESLPEVIVTANGSSNLQSIVPDYRISSPTSQQSWFTNFFLDDRTVNHGNLTFKVNNDGFATGLAPQTGMGALGLVGGPSSYRLGKNLIKSGVSRPANSAAHHIVAGNDRRARLARKLLAAEKIGINSAKNGIFLPRSSKFIKVKDAIPHSRIHTNLYYRELTKKLQNAGPGNVGKALEQFKQSILNGTVKY